MYVINRTFKKIDLSLTKDLTSIPEYSLPEGYRYVFFNDGDEKEWATIQCSSSKFLTEDEAMEAFSKSYGDKYDELKNSCIFIETNEGEKVATINAFHLNEPENDITGDLEYLAVKKEYQGKGLSKPLISKGLETMRKLGHNKTMVNTDTTEWLATNICLNMGFKPYKLEDSSFGWKMIKTITHNPVLTQVENANINDTYDPLCVNVYKYLKYLHGEPFNFKVTDNYIGINKDNIIHFYEYKNTNGKLEEVNELEDSNKAKSL